MTPGLQNNLFKTVSIVEVTTASAFQLDFANVPSVLNVNFEAMFALLLHTASANMHPSHSPGHYFRISLGTSEGNNPPLSTVLKNPKQTRTK